MCSCVSKKQYVTIGLDNGLVPNWKQTITWTKVDQILRGFIASLDLSEFWPKDWRLDETCTRHIEVYLHTPGV